MSHKAQFFFPEFNIRLYDKNPESDYFFFPPPKSEYFFSNIGNQNICLEKISKMKFNALSHLLQIHVTINITSNLIILPVNIIWKKMYISVWRIKFTNTTFGHAAWTWISAWMDLCTVGFWHKCKCCKLRTSIKKRARGQIIFMHININQWRNL